MPSVPVALPRWFRRGAAALLCALGASLAPSAGASTLALSEISNEPGVPADWMGAQVTFEVLDSILTVTLVNTTSSPTEFDVTELYFNSSSDIDDLVFLTAIGADGDNFDDWLWESDAQFSPYGIFDWALVGPSQGNDLAHVEPGETQVFTFSIRCAGGATCDDSDFVGEFSRFHDIDVQIAARFRNGPEDVSARGATAPEPDLAALLLVGAGALALRARRRR